VTNSQRKIERERALLEVVYDLDRLSSVEHTDRPDFVLRSSRDSQAFGVEVTELFETEAEARAHADPTYISRLLAGGRAMHRDDVETLAVSRVEIRDPNGNVKATDVPAIIRKSPALGDRARAIGERIATKSVSAVGYRHDLSHLNLVIGDMYGLPSERDGMYRVRDVIDPGVADALVAAPFDEVFLVGTTRDGRAEYRPLQLLLLMDSFYVFCDAVLTHDRMREEIDNRDLAPVFVSLRDVHGLPVRSAIIRGEPSVVYRRAGVTVANGQIETMDFNDWPTPTPVDLPFSCNDAVATSFLAHYIEHQASQSLVTALVIGEEHRRP
jgi:hypothetical protein